ncbi:thiamine transporter 1-like [Periplaneta americana]|uniref:thiamine transporter 1-like n=1 Tax=Periplaneta americana TaxID=6978 RepID=UPI0037E97FB0
METWLKLSLLLCVFGCVKEFRPSEPFITPYLMGEWKNFTGEDIEEIFSTGTYSYLVELVFVFLVTDLLRYKPVIIFDGIFAIITWSLLIWGFGVPVMQIMEVFYSFFLAAEVAYYTYIYAQVDKEHYQKVTSHTRAAYLTGRALSGVVSQLLVSYNVLDYYELNFISLTAVTLATIWVLFLPSVKHSIYFFRENRESQLEGIENPGVEIEDAEVSTKLSPDTTDAESKSRSSSQIQPVASHVRTESRWKAACRYMWQDLTQAYSNFYVIKWSIWWALTTCGFLQVLNYVQMLWQMIIDNNHLDSKTDIYNGAVEALYTVIGAVTSLLCGWVTLNWQVYGEATLAACALVEGALLMLSTQTDTMLVAYVYYILFGVIHHTMITVANAEVAKHINEDSYGLIFGLNTFLAVAFQTILTVIVVDKRGLALDTSTQFMVYGSYYLVLGAVFACMGVYTLIRVIMKKREVQQ